MDLTQLLPAMVPFIHTVGLRIDSIEPGRAVATLPYRPEVANHLQTAHAGAVYTLGESASGGVLLSVFADQLGTAYVALKSSRVTHRKARKGDVLAQATLVGDPAALRATYEAEGKVDFDVAVDLTVEGTPTAEIVFTWAIRAPR